MTELKFGITLPQRPRACTTANLIKARNELDNLLRLLQYEHERIDAVIWERFTTGHRPLLEGHPGAPAKSPATTPVDP